MSKAKGRNTPQRTEAAGGPGQTHFKQAASVVVVSKRAGTKITQLLSDLQENRLGAPQWADRLRVPFAYRYKELRPVFIKWEDNTLEWFSNRYRANYCDGNYLVDYLLRDYLLGGGNLNVALSKLISACVILAQLIERNVMTGPTCTVSARGDPVMFEDFVYKLAVIMDRAVDLKGIKLDIMKNCPERFRGMINFANNEWYLWVPGGWGYIDTKFGSRVIRQLWPMEGEEDYFCPTQSYGKTDTIGPFYDVSPYEAKLEIESYCLKEYDDWQPDDAVMMMNDVSFIIYRSGKVWSGIEKMVFQEYKRAILWLGKLALWQSGVSYMATKPSVPVGLGDNTFCYYEGRTDLLDYQVRVVENCNWMVSTATAALEAIVTRPVDGLEMERLPGWKLDLLDTLLVAHKMSDRDLYNLCTLTPRPKWSSFERIRVTPIVKKELFESLTEQSEMEDRVAGLAIE